MSTKERHDVYLALLKTERWSTTIMPELMRFFRKKDGTPDTVELMRYLQSMAGIEFSRGEEFKAFHDPKCLEELSRDVAVVMDLKGVPEPTDRVRICLAHEVSYSHACALYTAAFGRKIPEPVTDGTELGKLRAAANLLAEYPRGDKVIAEMFGLKAEQICEVRALRDGK